MRFLFGRKEGIPNVRPFIQARDTAGIREKASPHPRWLVGWERQRQKREKLEVKRKIAPSHMRLFSIRGRTVTRRRHFPRQISLNDEINRESNRARSSVRFRVRAYYRKFGGRE